ncbi:Ataxin-10 domain-containing protein [Jimgerdemannia flammicorona]|nr:Ataxin-10 domain-containing protein [Jimgerdemannia flammicorona]
MYIKRDVVRVLGNLAAGDQAIRQLGGISLVLNQCNIDDANPYIREHAIFALRNLLAGNAENQALIAEMTPLDAAQNPVLRDIGLRAEMGEGGKVRVRVAEEKRERGP